MHIYFGKISNQLARGGDEEGREEKRKRGREEEQREKRNRKGGKVEVRGSRKGMRDGKAQPNWHRKRHDSKAATTLATGKRQEATRLQLATGNLQLNKCINK